MVSSVCVCVCVCTCLYVVHHFVGTGVHCALPTCFVHHGAQGGPISVRSGGIYPSELFQCVVLGLDGKLMQGQGASSVQLSSTRQLLVTFHVHRYLATLTQTQTGQTLVSSSVSLSVCVSFIKIKEVSLSFFHELRHWISCLFKWSS